MRHGTCKTLNKINKSSKVCLTKEPGTEMFILVTSALELDSEKLTNFVAKKESEKTPERYYPLFVLCYEYNYKYENTVLIL